MNSVRSIERKARITLLISIRLLGVVALTKCLLVNATTMLSHQLNLEPINLNYWVVRISHDLARQQGER